MKYFVIFFVLIGFIAITSASMAYGLWVPQSPEELFEQSETVFVGNVTSVNVLEFERSNTFHIQENGVARIEIENYTQTLDEYTVTIEEFLKNLQTSDTITMLEATVGGVPGRSVSIGGFELGDRVLFYVPKIDGTNQYSPESFKIPKQCDAKSVLEQPRIDGFNDFKMTQDGIEKNDNFVADKPIKFVYNKDMDTLEGKSFDVNTKISKITGNDWETAIHKNIHTESKPCEWISAASWEFVPTGGRYYMWMKASEGNSTGGQSWSREFTVKEFDFPLRLFKSGVPVDKIQCNDDLVLLQKYDGSPACVAESTKTKLIERGWIGANQVTQDSLLERFSTMPEVIAFYETYEDAESSVKDDHVSYFAGSEDDFHVRMNLFFDENYDLDHMDFHCYYQNEHQFEFPQEDIVSKLEKYDCKK